MFTKAVKMDDEETPLLMQAFNPRKDPYAFSNAQYWFERKILEYPFREFDMEIHQSSRDKLLLAVGELSNKEAGNNRATVALSQLWLEVVNFPGGHLDFASYPWDFGQRLWEALKTLN